MKTLAFAVAPILFAVPLAAPAQTWKPPAESERCPSKWGAGDERGSANHMKPDAVLNAARLIRTGEVIETRPRAQRGHADLRPPAGLICTPSARS